MSDQHKFDFMEELPRRPNKPERLFLGVFPNEYAAHAAERIGRAVTEDIGLTGSFLRANRYHTSLVHISDRKRVRAKDEFAAQLAVSTLSVAPFEISFSRIGSFHGIPKKGGRPKYPLVLLADHGPVMDLYGALGAGLRSLQYRVPEHFDPHLTLAYSQQFVRMRPINPVTFVVKEVVLVHSRLWLTEYKFLRTWTLH